jgi:hypothetical protein
MFFIYLVGSTIKSNWSIICIKWKCIETGITSTRIVLIYSDYDFFLYLVIDKDGQSLFFPCYHFFVSIKNEICDMWFRSQVVSFFFHDQKFLVFLDLVYIYIYILFDTVVTFHYCFSFWTECWCIKHVVIFNFFFAVIIDLLSSNFCYLNLDRRN